MSLTARKEMLEKRDFVQDFREAAKMKAIWLRGDGHIPAAKVYEDVETAFDRLDAFLAREILDADNG